MSTRRSARYPAVRGGLSGLLSLLMPFVWVVDVSSCGGDGPVQRELSGLALLGRFELRWTALVLLTVVVSAVTPFIAARVTKAARELWVHVLGLVATGFFAWLGHMTMFFTIFSERDLRGAGVLVLVVLASMVADAVARVGFSARQWWASRRASAA